MKRKSGKTAEPRPSLANATYYGVITVSALAGFMAYSSGATLEGSLVRTVITLLACTILGYVLNVVLLLAAQTPQPAAAEMAPAAVVTAAAGPRVNLVAGDEDDGSDSPAERQAPTI